MVDEAIEVKAESERSPWNKLRDLPLRYRLSIPFFFLALLGTISLVWLAVRSQNALVTQYERNHLEGSYSAFRDNIGIDGRWAAGFASVFARNPDVVSALAGRDRLRLVDLCYSSYLFLRDRFGISQFNFHTAAPRNFVRLQRLYEFGDDIGYRRTIRDALSKGRETSGLEKGLTGYGIRGVAPVYFEGNIVGTIEIGFAFDPRFLERMKKQFGVEASVLAPGADPGHFHAWGGAGDDKDAGADPLYAEVFRDGVARTAVREAGGVPVAVLVGRIEDYGGAAAGLVELLMDRSETISVIARYRTLMIGIGIAGMLLSVGAIFLISGYFSQPIAKMVDFARKIAIEPQGQRLDIRPSGELGVLADALNDMLASLETSREELQNWAANLEHMVHARTRALRESEEKYRTVVENAPLVVYRLLGNGGVIFINHYIEELMGISPRDVMRDALFWMGKVHPDDRGRVWPLMERCLREGREFKAEYRMRESNGKILFVLDHALPVFDENGKVETVDGILVDVTDRHKLQQQIIQTEELRTLSEISARLAHEIRNPLAAAGGFARRLLQSLGPEDAHLEKVRIIVSEVARLDGILEKTLAYLKPFEVVMERVSLNESIRRVLALHGNMFQDRSLGCETSFSPEAESVLLDPVLIERGLESIVGALASYCPAGGVLEVRTWAVPGAVNVEIAASGIRISDDDLDDFFYPFTSRLDASLMIDLPLAKMIMHKHRGLIQLSRKDPQQLVLNISLPQ